MAQQSGKCSKPGWIASYIESRIQTYAFEVNVGNNSFWVSGGGKETKDEESRVENINTW